YGFCAGAVVNIVRLGDGDLRAGEEHGGRSRDTVGDSHACPPLGQGESSRECGAAVTWPARCSVDALGFPDLAFSHFTGDAWEIGRLDADVGAIRVAHRVQYCKSRAIARLLIRAGAGQKFGQELHA